MDWSKLNGVVKVYIVHLSLHYRRGGNAVLFVTTQQSERTNNHCGDYNVIFIVIVVLNNKVI